MELSKTQLRNWLAVNRLLGGSCKTDELSLLLQQDIDLSKGPYQLLKDQGLSSEIIKKIAQFDWASVDDEIKWSEQPYHHIITLLDDNYPSLLGKISAPPMLLYVKGDLHLLSKPQLAMVGSRNPTPMGMETAKQFARYLAERGLVITSGLALGIDAASHEGALKTGKTIAVMGTGLDEIYPQRNQALSEKVIENGALVSEFSPKTKPLKMNFPRRNRIISGLSLGVLVVEATIKSGSLISARFAAEQGREVFAVPGSIHNPVAKGCHKLIKDGAKLVESAEDIFEELQDFLQINKQLSLSLPDCSQNDKKIPQGKETKGLDFPSLDEDYNKLLGCIGYESTAVEIIIARSGFPAKEVSSMILMLELQGFVSSVAGGYSRIKKMG